MPHRSLTIGVLLGISLLTAGSPAGAASGQVPLPLAHRLQGILVEVHRPQFLFGTKKVARGFVAHEDGVVLVPMAGLEDVDLEDEVSLQWADGRSADGWVAWKDREVGFVIVRIHEPMPLFAAVGWRQDGGPRPGETLLAPGSTTGGQPTLAKAVVTGLRRQILRSGRSLEPIILVTPALGAGPLESPLLDETGHLAAMVTRLPPPPGAAPETVVAVPLSAVWPDLVAARRMRPPRPMMPPHAAAPAPYRIGIGIGSGGVYPRIGIGSGGVYPRTGIGMGGLGGRSRRGGWPDRREDPYLRREQETSDRAKTEALERALEQQAGGQPTPSSLPLTNTQPLPKEQTSSTSGAWRAGASSVTSTGGAGQVREVRPEPVQGQRPSIGSTWNPAGPPLTASPSGQSTKPWTVVIEPEVPISVRQQQREVDRTRTETLERALGRQGVAGAPAGASTGEITVGTVSPASGPTASPGGRSTEELEAELAVVRARQEALQRELEALR